MRIEHKAILYLLLTTLFWGLTFPLIKISLQYMDANTFVAMRFACASLFFLPLAWGKFHRLNAKILGFSLVLGLFNTCVYLFQTIGLETTSSANTAFLTALTVVLIPFFMPLFKVGHITSLNIACSLISLCGIFILTGSGLTHITSGDCWILACAVFNALGVCYLQYIAKRTQEFTLLTFLQLVFVIPVPLALSHTGAYSHIFYWPVMTSVLICATFATCLTYYWQFKWQSKITPAKAGLIYALEPVFATVFAWIINNEGITQNTLIGGLLILVALLTSELGSRFIYGHT